MASGMTLVLPDQQFGEKGLKISSMNGSSLASATTEHPTERQTADLTPPAHLKLPRQLVALTPKRQHAAKGRRWSNFRFLSHLIDVMFQLSTFPRLYVFADDDQPGRRSKAYWAQ